MTMTINGTEGFVFPDNTSQATAATGFGFKNRLLNGAMQIDQRNAGASVTYPGSGSVGSELYTLDRWAGNSTGSTRFSVQRSTTAPAGFNNSMLITTTTAGTPASGDFCYFVQSIEGFNVSDLGFGTANAHTVTLSFWIRSSLTGAFGGSLANSAANRRYPFSFTISAANTWEYKTVTITGDTTGTWLTDNGRGMVVSFNLGSGSSNKNTAGAWATSGMAPTGSVDLVATAGATLNITGVQLEKGSTATSFDYRPYGTELQLCQRYYEIGTAYGDGYTTLNAPIYIGYTFKVTKRAAPTTTYPTFTNITNARAGADRAVYVDSYARYCLANATGPLAATETFTASAEL